MGDGAYGVVWREPPVLSYRSWAEGGHFTCLLVRDEAFKGWEAVSCALPDGRLVERLQAALQPGGAQPASAERWGRGIPAGVALDGSVRRVDGEDRDRGRADQMWERMR